MDKDIEDLLFKIGFTSHNILSYSIMYSKPYEAVFMYRENKLYNTYVENNNKITLDREYHIIDDKAIIINELIRKFPHYFRKQKIKYLLNN